MYVPATTSSGAFRRRQRPDVAALLARVGLQGFEERETAGLSGGELQRLAIAACLAREPRLLISDEATAMIDAPGRAEVVALLESLAAAGITVVHVTHREAEAAKADETILMLAGRRSPRSHHRPLGGQAYRARCRERLRAARGLPLRSKSSTDRAHPAGPARLEPCARARLPRQRRAPGELGYVYANGTPWARRALEGVDLDLQPRRGRRRDR